MNPSSQPKKKYSLLYIFLGVVLAVLVCGAIGAGHIEKQREHAEICEKAEAELAAENYDTAAIYYRSAGEETLAQAADDLQLDRKNAYQRGLLALDEKRYDDAVTAFLEAGKYSDAAEQLELARTELRYVNACDTMREGKYEEAVKLFTDLEGFRDSEERIAECDQHLTYAEGVAALEAEDYEQAVICFSKLGDYEDAKFLLSEAETERQQTQWLTACEEKGVDLPRPDEWLAEPMSECQVHSKSGNGVYLRDSRETYETKVEMNEHFMCVLPDLTVVQVLAASNGYYLVSLHDGRIGWITASMVY